ncbi:hypothetical protein J2T20_002664 [Paenibacillus wynnii]|nr:hypothetical protein [Paenibacillus wynnii]
MRVADDKESFHNFGDNPFVFIMKCDFEPKIARSADEKSLISQVEMAISARNRARGGIGKTARVDLNSSFWRLISLE